MTVVERMMMLSSEVRGQRRDEQIARREVVHRKEDEQKR
jgi:hypothetical protein